jgi:Winged helix-turn helix
LNAGPAKAGFDAGGWTLARIAAVVADRFGVVYHRYGLWYLLRRRGWSVQRPVVAARERDEATRRRSRRRSRRGGASSGRGYGNEARRRGAWIVFADESGVSTRPPLRTTWARRGHTPRVVTPGRRRWLRTYALPSYAYDLNPADGLWNNLKTVDLANRVNTDLDDIERAVARGMCRIRHRPDLL